MKVAVPVGIAMPLTPFTVAVNVNCWPKLGVMLPDDEMTATLEAAAFTVCVIADETLPAKLTLPKYRAVI